MDASQDRRPQIGTASAVSIGIGGMVGGGIFAVTGLTIQLTRGAAPVAFVVAGIVALLTAYSYWRLSLRYPSRGGTVEFLNVAFGPGVFTGGMNILLCLGYVILISVYAYAFGVYGARFFPAEDQAFWTHALITGVIVGLAAVNFVGAEAVMRSENLFNATKLLLLGAFVVAGLASPIAWERLGTSEWVPPEALFGGAMIIFLNYEGFELVANATEDLVDPRRALPLAYLGGVALVIVVYALIAVVVVGHLDFDTIARQSDHVLSVAAGEVLGTAGAATIVVAALLATSSAINASFYGAGRLTYLIARSGELPAELERSIRGQPLEGMFLFALLSLVVANFVPLAAIATLGSASFLLIFLAVNVAAMRLRRETGGSAWLSLLGALSCLAAVVSLVMQTLDEPDSGWHALLLGGMVLLSFALEAVYRAISGRQIRLRHLRSGEEDEPGER